eukprot:1314471-Pleurochrysis_carterae.AAC.1
MTHALKPAPRNLTAHGCNMLTHTEPFAREKWAFCARNPGGVFRARSGRFGATGERRPCALRLQRGHVGRQVCAERAQPGGAYALRRACGSTRTHAHA